MIWIVRVICVLHSIVTSTSSVIDIPWGECLFLIQSVDTRLKLMKNVVETFHEISRRNIKFRGTSHLIKVVYSTILMLFLAKLLATYVACKIFMCTLAILPVSSLFIVRRCYYTWEVHLRYYCVFSVYNSFKFFGSLEYSNSIKYQWYIPPLSWITASLVINNFNVTGSYCKK